MGTVGETFKYTVTALVFVAGISAPAFAQETVLDGLFQELLEADEESHAEIRALIIAQQERSGSAAMDLLLRRGGRAMEENQPEVAVEHFTALVDHAPDYAEGYHARASAYFALGYVGPALDDLRQTLVLQPNHFEAMFGVGNLMEYMGRPEDAKEVYEAILVIYPLDINANEAIARLNENDAGQAL